MKQGKSVDVGKQELVVKGVSLRIHSSDTWCLSNFHCSVFGVTKTPPRGAHLAADPAQNLLKFHFCSDSEKWPCNLPFHRVLVTMPGRAPGLEAPQPGHLLGSQEWGTETARKRRNGMWGTRGRATPGAFGYWGAEKSQLLGNTEYD